MTWGTKALGVVAMSLGAVFPAWGQGQTPSWQAQVRSYADAHDWASAMRLVEQEIARAPRDIDVRAWRARLPRKSIEAIQVIEYLRAFLIGREAWAQGNMLMIIAGAFGLFRTDLVRAVGGYRSRSIGEDFDLVARLHRHLRETDADCEIRFVPDPVCWTEVPSDLQSLARQRARWQKGLLDVLWPNRDMLFRTRYGRIGWFALPYLWLFELVAPIVEIAGIATIALAAGLGVPSREFFLQFLIFGYAFATVISVGAVLQEEITYKRYNEWKDVVRLVSYCFFEHFPYRQLHMIWRLQGLWQYLRGDFEWKPVKRKGLASARTQ
ncbi:MAG TPA: glycosyltransferase family 2 protein [Candidatus Acidoferrum sp.]|nr:glycosyltransferase family 2 protein [Candidatus Acidoferrum sp.]